MNFVLFWATISFNEKLLLKFNKRLKINAEYYKQKILATYLLRHADRLYLKRLDVSAIFHSVASIQNNAGMNSYQLPGVYQARRLAIFFSRFKFFRIYNAKNDIVCLAIFDNVGESR